MADTYASNRHERYGQTLDSISDKLRGLADEIQRVGQADWLTGHDDGTDHSRGASRALHSITAAMANLGLDRLVEVAAQADTAALKEAST